MPKLKVERLPRALVNVGPVGVGATVALGVAVGGVAAVGEDGRDGVRVGGDVGVDVVEGGGGAAGSVGRAVGAVVGIAVRAL